MLRVSIDLLPKLLSFIRRVCSGYAPDRGCELSWCEPVEARVRPVGVRLRSRSCIIDGEAVACDDNGIASFELIRQHRVDAGVFLYAFDLLELNGDDLRRDPLRSARRRSHPWWLRPSPASGSTSTW
jgi:hypothetical protein